MTIAIRELRSNELPSWEIREAEMRRQEAADLRALRRRVAKAVTTGIAFLDETGGDCDVEEDAGEMAETDSRYGNLDDEPSLCGVHVTAAFAKAAFGDHDLEAEHDGREPDVDGEPSLCGIEVGYGDDRDREGPDDNGIADMAGWNEQRSRYLDNGGDKNRAGSAF
ncbi:hypothetical protein [Methylobacterium sp. WL19]|uniref:hypothetical protein n=1 Tax=Methylobacterium sp. WL19 TaxID=2603896 RepID=UPI0011CB7D02|nr:hypothetical protein [Methylobacterium sp. WL19]TXN27142.1 hypothetical protein FV220_12535 [Methylobacterium sp. WL19]